MSVHPELVSEQAYLDRAYERVDELRAIARSQMDELLDIGRGGTFQARTERDVVVRSALHRLEQLEIGNQPLCFGRIDEAEGERFYVGRLGISDRNQEPLVVDWRAPVAEPFYRATGRFPMGIVRRRHFQLEGRRLTGIEDEPLVLSENGEDDMQLAGKGALLAALERGRSGRMNDIVATIQGEQDEVIRAPLPGVLVVQGGPGTGKTAVALHRAAYLLYTHRFPLERQGVLVLGPNPLFLRYIGHVLPSLGETGVTLSTVARLVHDAPVRGTDSSEVAAIKGDKRMAKVIANAVRNRQRPIRKPVRLGFGSYSLELTPQESAEIVGQMRRRGGTHNARRKRIEQSVIQRLYDKYTGAVERARKLAGSVNELDLERFGAGLKEQPEFYELLDRMWPRLYPTELVHDLFGAKPLLELAAKGNFKQEEAALLYRERSHSMDEIPWTDGDMALIDEALVLLGPFKPLKDDEQLIPTFGHIVVDEAQDLSPMQLRMVARRSLGGSVTMVGDIAQATGPWAPSHWDEVLAHLPQRWQNEQVELTVGYRTPAEAMALAERVLRQTRLGLIPPRPVRQSGEEPAMVSTSAESLAKSVLEAVANEQNIVGGGTIGVVVPMAMLDEMVGAFNATELDFGVASSGALDKQVSLLGADMAKGLEFDSVIVVEPAAMLQVRHGLRSLYVALTRTTRRLTIVHAEPLPKFLAESPQAALF